MMHFCEVKLDEHHLRLAQTLGVTPEAMVLMGLGLLHSKVNNLPSAKEAFDLMESIDGKLDAALAILRDQNQVPQAPTMPTVPNGAMGAQ